MFAVIHEATPAELDDWDAHTVDVPGGDVFQSRTFGEYRGRHGWRPRFLVFDDGFCLLAMERPWPWIGGSSVYMPRGPVAAGEAPERTADRVREAADWLAARGADVVATDAEIPSAAGYRELLAARGFRAIEEIQVARHRQAVDLEAIEADQFRLIDPSTRGRIRQAEKWGARVVRFDARIAPDEIEGAFEPLPAGALKPEALEPILRAFHVILGTTADRLGFRNLLFGVDNFIDWSTHAITAGLAVYLEVRAPEGELLGGSLFHRNGRRLTYAYAADRYDVRKAHPGVLHLLVWRGIQLAMRGGLREFDLGGVDVPGARRKPIDGEGTFGLLKFKEAFGAHWVDQSGAFEWVARPSRYALGRVLAGVARRVRR